MVEKRVKNSGRGLPPLFGQCPKENIFFFRRASLTHLDGSSLSDDISDDVRLSSIVEFVFLAEMAKEGERFSIGPTWFHSAVTL